MSVENLKEYARRCAEEPELRARAKAIGLSNPQEHRELAATLGLDWTMDDMAALQKELIASKESGESGALSDEDLEQIAGGFVTATMAVVGVVAVVGVAVSAGSGEGW